MAGTIRAFRWSDLEPLAETITRLAGHGPECSAHYLRELLLQPNLAPERDCFVCEWGNTVIGYVLLTPELPLGRTVLHGGVLPEYRGRGYGKALLHRALEHSRWLGAGLVDVAVPEDSPGARELLERAELTHVRTFWHMRCEPVPQHGPELPEGYTHRPFQLGDEARLTAVQNAAFAGSWGFLPNTVEEISYRVRLSRCQFDGIRLLLASGDSTAAYCWTRVDPTPGGEVGAIWMIGVAPEFQGRGLGKQALLAGTWYLRERGVRAVELEVDSLNSSARELYLSLGFHKVRDLLWYQARLDGPSTIRPW